MISAIISLTIEESGFKVRLNLSMLIWLIAKCGSLYYKLGPVLQREATLLQQRGKHYYRVGQLRVTSKSNK